VGSRRPLTLQFGNAAAPRTGAPPVQFCKIKEARG
jgi:hypothetical protein